MTTQTIFASKLLRGNEVTLDSFLAPVMTAENTVKRGQILKPGMFVRVDVKDHSWGRTRISSQFRGVCVSYNSERRLAMIRPLCGLSTTVAIMRINNDQFAAGRDGLPKQLLTVAVNRQHIRILNARNEEEDTMRRGSTSMMAYVRWNIDHSRSSVLDNFKQKMYNKLAELEFNRRCSMNKFGAAGRKEAIQPGSYPWIRVSTWKPHTEQANQVKTALQAIAKAAKRVEEGRDGYQFLNSIRTSVNSANMSIALNVWHAKHPDNPVSPAGCGHYEFVNRIAEVMSRHGEESYCQHCMQGIQTHTLLNEIGVEVLARTDFRGYTWPDGSKRTHQPPPVIGEYHSSKRRIGALPNLDGTHFNGLTIGVELEMECVPGCEGDREDAAQRVMGRILNAKPEGWNGKRVPGYAFLERDGSVSYGFEMVTSYGSAEVHRYHIEKIFGRGEDGKLPYRRLLHSHDARSSCGLHVHLAKPKSLMHAVKMQAFYNDPANKQLIKAIARRYSVNYAKVAEGKDKANVQYNTKRSLGGNIKRMIRSYGYTWQQVIENAVTNLSDGDRYQMVNFTNPKTVEIRVFKGSMMPVTILACVEFAQAAWLFSRDHAAADLTTEKFCEYISAPENRHETRYLRTYLSQRGFNVYMPRQHASAPAVITELTPHEENA
jgi:hypothetical protein